METLAWNRNESDVVLSGRVFHAASAEVAGARPGRAGSKFLPLYAVLVTLGKVRHRAASTAVGCLRLV
jgi:hypothetical protein